MTAPKKKQAKFVQISATFDGRYDTVYALDEYGRVWWLVNSVAAQRPYWTALIEREA